MRYPKEVWNKLIEYRDKFFEDDSVEQLIVRAIRHYLKHIEDDDYDK